MDLTVFLTDIGVKSEKLIAFINISLTLLLACLIGWLMYFITKKWLARTIIRLVRRTPTKWDDLMFGQTLFSRLGLLVAPIAMYVVVSSIENWKNLYILTRLLEVWITFSTVFVLSALLDGANRIYESYPMSKNRPMKIFIQIILIFLFCAAILVTINIFTSRSYNALIQNIMGLTALAAIIMLIFKDSILGFVAGIQLTVNDMVRIGDWIVMSSSNADGEVREINLTTVKVQNWDKSITTIPTYKMVSESFTNWRGMEESKGRRIKRSVYIDINSIHYLNDKEIETLKKSALLKNYLNRALAELEELNTSRSEQLDKFRLTNLGTFRAYLEVWLSCNPDINLEMTHMVRQLQPGPTGIPLEIYCFSARQNWIDYERIQADIFDHVIAVMGLFGLKSFQYSGNIVQA